MRPAGWAGTHSRGLFPVGVLVLALSGLAAGCGSSAPAYCTDASQLKTSVQDLGNVDVAKNGLDSLQTALSSVQADAKTFTTDAKSAFPSQTAALNTALSGLQTAINSAKGQPPLTAAATVASSVTQVKNSASALQSAVSGTCQ
jgi:prophage DNA circulation protein